MKLISRKEAKEQGLKRYYTGRSCKRGHIAERLVNGFKCLECDKEWKINNDDYYKRYRKMNSKKAVDRAKKWAKDNPERSKELRTKSNRKHRLEKRDQYLYKRRINYRKNIEKERNRNKKYKNGNREKVNEMARRHYHNNKHRISIYRKLYRSRNPFIHCANEAKRKAAKLKATPSWANLEEIKKVYAESKKLSEETGVLHHVDHVVPLRGKAVCGLHVHYNLQVITAIENSRKYNKMVESC